MIIQCEGCKTRFRVADEKVTGRGARVRCARCGKTFVVQPSTGAKAAAPPEARRPQAKAPPAAAAEARITSTGASVGDLFADLEMGERAALGSGAAAVVLQAPGTDLDPFADLDFDAPPEEEDGRTVVAAPDSDLLARLDQRRPEPSPVATEHDVDAAISAIDSLAESAAAARSAVPEDAEAELAMSLAFGEDDGGGGGDPFAGTFDGGHGAVLPPSLSGMNTGEIESLDDHAFDRAYGSTNPLPPGAFEQPGSDEDPAVQSGLDLAGLKAAVEEAEEGFLNEDDFAALDEAFEAATQDDAAPPPPARPADGAFFDLDADFARELAAGFEAPPEPESGQDQVPEPNVVWDPAPAESTLVLSGPPALDEAEAGAPEIDGGSWDLGGSLELDPAADGGGDPAATAIYDAPPKVPEEAPGDLGGDSLDFGVPEDAGSFDLGSPPGFSLGEPGAHLGAPEEEEEDPFANLDVGGEGAVLARFDVGPASAPEPSPPPPVAAAPRPPAKPKEAEKSVREPSPRRAVAWGALIGNALFGAALLGVGLAAFVAFRTSGPTDATLFSSERIARAFAPPAARGLAVVELRNGLYPTAAGKVLLVVRGEAVNPGPATAAPEVVSIRLVDASGEGLGRRTAVLGAVPAPDEVFTLDPVGGVEELHGRLSKQAPKAIAPGERVPFFVLFDEYPETLRGVHFLVDVGTGG